MSSFLTVLLACPYRVEMCRSCRKCWAWWLLEDLQRHQQEARCAIRPAGHSAWVRWKQVAACAHALWLPKAAARFRLTVHASMPAPGQQQVCCLHIGQYVNSSCCTSTSSCHLHSWRMLTSMLLLYVQVACSLRQLYGSWTRNHLWTRPAGDTAQLAAAASASTCQLAR